MLVSLLFVLEDGFDSSMDLVVVIPETPGHKVPADYTLAVEELDLILADDIMQEGRHCLDDALDLLWTLVSSIGP